MGLKRELLELAESVINGKHIRAEELTRDLLSSGCPPAEILNQGLMPGMDHVGREFREGRYFLPLVLVAARAMKKSFGGGRSGPVITDPGLKGDGERWT
jgi:5-methyltetrahydrofolate--homocysteine methyltransferase